MNGSIKTSKDLQSIRVIKFQKFLLRNATRYYCIYETVLHFKRIRKKTRDRPSNEYYIMGIEHMKYVLIH